MFSVTPFSVWLCPPRYCLCRCAFAQLELLTHMNARVDGLPSHCAPSAKSGGWGRDAKSARWPPHVEVYTPADCAGGTCSWSTHPRTNAFAAARQAAVSVDGDS